MGDRVAFGDECAVGGAGEGQCGHPQRLAQSIEVSDGVGGGVEPPVVPDGVGARLHGARRRHGQIRVAHRLL
jgi:hypothetical protein